MAVSSCDLSEPAREDDGPHRVAGAADRAQRVEAGQPRHADVEEQQIGLP